MNSPLDLVFGQINDAVTVGISFHNSLRLLLRAILVVWLGVQGLCADPTTGESELAQLRKENEALRAENQRLRRMLAEPTVEKFAQEPKKNAPIDVKAAVESLPVAPNAKRLSYWLSDSGKRHNARCRYFQTTKGSPCSAKDGTPCKICGG